MSWASSEWKNELSAVAVKKVEEMEKQRDRMSKEMKQNKQQVDAIEQMMSKQREKYEKERITHSSLVTDNAMLVESCDKLETKRHRLEHELSAKNNKLQNLQNNHDQTRRLLDEESNKAVAMENKVSQLQRIVRELEEKEKHNSTSVQQMKDALQDQHWKDVASLADERQTSEALKVELLRTRANAQYKDSICKSEENRAANDKIDNLEDKIEKLKIDLRKSEQFKKSYIEQCKIDLVEKENATIIALREDNQMLKNKIKHLKNMSSASASNARSVNLNIVANDKDHLNGNMARQLRKYNQDIKKISNDKSKLNLEMLNLKNELFEQEHLDIGDCNIKYRNKDIKTNIISSEKTCDQDQEMIYKQLQEKLSAAEFQIENINSKYDLLHKNYKKICNENKGMKSKSSSFANTQKSQNRRRFN